MDVGFDMAEARQNKIDRTLKPHGLTPTQGAANANVALLESFEIGQSGIEETRTVWGLTESNGDGAYKTSMMNYSFICFNGLRPKSYDQTIVLIERRDFALPHFLLTRREIFHWLEKIFKIPTITFLESETFNKMYQLKSEDELAVRALFRPTVCIVLEQHPGLTIEGHDQQLIIFRERILLDSSDWPAFLKEARELADLLAS
jgi:hypothetical protein